MSIKVFVDMKNSEKDSKQLRNNLLQLEKSNATFTQQTQVLSKQLYTQTQTLSKQLYTQTELMNKLTTNMQEMENKF